LRSRPVLRPLPVAHPASPNPARAADRILSAPAGRGEQLVGPPAAPLAWRGAPDPQTDGAPEGGRPLRDALGRWAADVAGQDEGARRGRAALPRARSAAKRALSSTTSRRLE